MQHPQTTARPALWAVYAGTPIALAAVAALSYEPQSALGHAVGWGSHVAWLMPIAVITCELVATMVFFWTEAGPARWSAGHVTFAAIAMSYGLSATWHVLHPGSVCLGVTLAVSAVPNLVAALMLHTAMSISSAPKAEVVPAEALPPEPVLELPAPEPRPPLPEPSKRPRPRKTSGCAKAKALAALAALPEGSPLPSAADLAAEYSRTDRWAREVLAEARSTAPAEAA